VNIGQKERLVLQLNNREKKTRILNDVIYHKILRQGTIKKSDITTKMTRGGRLCRIFTLLKCVFSLYRVSKKNSALWVAQKHHVNPFSASVFLKIMSLFQNLSKHFRRQ